MIVDFKYDNEYLSTYGCVIAYIGGNEEQQEIGNQLAPNNIKSANSNVYLTPNISYSDVYSPSSPILIVKSSDALSPYFDDYEISQLLRWLNKKNYKKFEPIYSDRDINSFYMATFNISFEKHYDKVIGLYLTMMTNSPNGFLNNEIIEFSNVKTFTIEDVSQDVGYLYCKATITCKEAGDLIIENDIDDNKIIIDNCKNGDVINLDGITKTIECDTHDGLYDDFNFNYFRVFNTYNNNVNNYTSSLSIDISVDYTPIVKAGLIT